MKITKTLTSIGCIGTREIQYLSIFDNRDWVQCLPKKKWLALIINHKCEEETLFQLVLQCQKNKKLLDLRIYQNKLDFEDETLMDAEINKRANSPKQLEIYFTLMGLPKYHNLEYGLYYISSVAHVDFLAAHTDEYTVVCVDCNANSSKNDLEAFVHRINASGYTPPNE